MDQRELKSLLNYDPDTGIFTWISNRPGTKGAGSVAGVIMNNGYRQIMINRRHYLAHRLAFLYMTGKIPDLDVDHINRDRSDNRWANLRAVNKSENLFNLGLDPRNKVGAAGVSWSKSTGRWQASIQAYRNPRHLGFFDSVDEASSAYQAAKKSLHSIQSRED